MTRELPPGAVQSPGCFACGRENPRGLRLAFAIPEPGRACAAWTSSAEWEGFRGIVHGGIVSTLLDEAMSQAVASLRWPALTCELRVRLRRHAAAGETFHVSGWVVERSRRKVLAEAALCGPDGIERAHAWGVFLILPGEHEPVSQPARWPPASS